MPATTKEILKGYFKAGSIPTESNFTDLIDSALLISGNSNVGIGNSDPVARLQVEGSGNGFPATFGSTQSAGHVLRLKTSSNNAILDFGGNSDSGAWLQSTDQLDLNLNYPFLINPNGGNVGIGTTAPVARLQVAVPGSAFPTNTKTNQQSVGHILRLTAENETLDIGGKTDGGIWLQSTDQRDLSCFFPLLLNPNGGNVGIGTTSPTTAKLVISGPAGSEGLDLASTDQYANLRVIRNSLGVVDKDMYFGLGSGQNSSLHLYSNNYESITVRSGNVGISNTAPVVRLDIGGSIHLAGPSPDPAPQGTFIGWNKSGNIGETNFVNNQGTGLGGFTFENTDYTGKTISRLVTILGSGNVGIGTPSTTVPAGRLHISETIGTVRSETLGTVIIEHLNMGGASSIVFPSAKNKGSDYAYIQYQDDVTISGTGEAAIFTIGIQNDTNDHIALMPSGYVGIKTTSPQYQLDVAGEIKASGNVRGASFVNNSDLRIKNIIGVTNNVEDLAALTMIEITNYTLRDESLNSGKLNKKVIAQQVNEVYPIAVTQSTVTEYIPDVYQQANSFSYDGDALSIALKTPLSGNTTVKDGSKCKIYLTKTSGSKKEVTGTVLSLNDTTLQLKLDEIINFAEYDEDLLIYGGQINDMLLVDYHALSTLNISATQELARMVTAMQAEIDSLKSQLAK